MGVKALKSFVPRDPARLPSDEPPIVYPPKYTTVKAAATDAAIGMISTLDKPNPRMVAICTAQAITIAVSSSCSYTAFITAITAAESYA